MDKNRRECPDCADGVDRRRFLLTAGATAAAAAGLPLFAVPKVTAAPTPNSPAETAVKALFDMLTDDQKKVMCFGWDFKDDKNGVLRTHVSNNWQITKPNILSDFYTKKQQDVIHDIWKGIINPEWYDRFVKQLKDDTGGADWGEQQSIAIFGKPGGDKFEFVMTGRHMTLRADGHSTDHVAFGGPIFYGHAASGFNEKVHHPGNVFWPQAQAANKVYQMLDPKQQTAALVLDKLPKPESSSVGFPGDKGAIPGVPVKELADEQKKELQRVLSLMLDPFRKDDQEEAMACLKRQGGLDHLNLAFYKDGDIGNDGEWDNWRLEGPSFNWYFRGFPHVHVWVNVADDPALATNAQG